MDKRNKEYLIGIYEKSMPIDLTWDEKFERVKQLGFDYLEISIDETDEKLARLNDQKEIKDIKKAITEHQIPIKSMCLSGHRKYPLGSKDDEVREKGLQIFYDAVDFASELGIRTIQLAGYDVYYDEGDTQTEKRFYEYLLNGVHYAASRQVVCGFETMETSFMNTVKKAMSYVKKVDSPYLQVYPDLGNLTNASTGAEDLYSDIESGCGHIVAAHLKETVPGVFREVLFDTGHVDFNTGIKQLWNQGVRSFVCECWYTGQEDYMDELAFNYEFLTTKINKIMKESK